MATSLLITLRKPAATWLRNSEFDAASLITTVCASGVSIAVIGSARKDALPLMFFSRSNDHFTSFASTGEPSENFAAGSSLKVNSVCSGLDVQLDARSGCTLLSLSSVTSCS
jgi:hypothetical protein